MNYVSLRFWAFLGCIMLAYGVIRLATGRSWREGNDRWVLLATSLTLFALESVLSFWIFVGVGLWVFGITRLVPRVRGRARWVVVGLGVFVALLPLASYKYWSSGVDGMLIPIGISFYSFQMIGLLVDSSRESENKPLDLRAFFNFAAFFPQIVAGPIERKGSLMPQLESFRFRYSREDAEAGLRLVVLGLFYKLVVANNITESSSWITVPIESPWIIHYANVVFGLRIYFDFCGYSLIALGLGRVLGVRLTENFRAPYLQRNVQDFWRTWHVSLSGWFRDYVYVPLGGNRARFPALVVLAVFIVSGVWHGAGWNYVLWGAAHGIYLVAFLKLRKFLALPGFLSWLVTLGCVMTAWLFFYQLESSILFAKAGRILQLSEYATAPFDEFLRISVSHAEVAYSLATSVLGFLVIGLEWLSVRRTGEFRAWSRPMGVQVVLVVLLVWLTPISDNGFVYFNF